MTHPVVEAVLGALPGVTVQRAQITADGEYHHGERAILIRHGLRGPAWVSALVHEALHARRGDQRCTTPEMETRQEEIVNRDAARLLIEVRDLGEAAAAHPDDPHAVADQLGVDYRTLVCRVHHLHPSERHYLQRRLAHTEESA